MTIREWLESAEHRANCWAENEGFPEQCCVMKLEGVIFGGANVLDMEMPASDFERDQRQFMAEMRDQAERDHR